MNPLNRTATSPKRPAIWLLAAVLLAFVSFFLTTHSSAQEADAEAAETAPATEAADNESKSETETESPSTDTAEEQLGFSDKLNKQLDATLGTVNGYLFKVLFFDISFSAFDYITTDKETGESVEVEPEVPFLVIFLTLGAVFFTFWHKLINIRHFFHAWGIVSGKYTHESDEGDLSPFRALTSALSATVGLGNIASVAVAMVAGGPGALFWMMFLGLCGMCAKFHESTLAQMFRIKNEDGTVRAEIDNGIRTHGSVDYMSILRRYSHGCHRLYNMDAVRLFSYVLRHRDYTRHGQQNVGVRRNLEVDGKSYLMKIDTRGYKYELVEPIPIRVLEGRIRGSRQYPVEDYVPKPVKPSELEAESADGELIVDTPVAPVTPQ